jgi:hypothetical protein
MKPIQIMDTLALQSILDELEEIENEAIKNKLEYDAKAKIIKEKTTSIRERLERMSDGFITIKDSLG